MKGFFSKLRRGFTDIRVTGKLTIFYLVTIFLPLFLFFSALLTNLNQSFRTQYLTEKKYMLEQSGNLFDGVRTQTDYMASTLQSSDAMILFLVGGYRNASDEVYSLLREINPMFERFFMSSNTLKSIYVFRYQNSNIPETKYIRSVQSSAYEEAELRALRYNDFQMYFYLSGDRVLMDVLLPIWKGGTISNVGVCECTLDITGLMDSISVLQEELFVMEANGVYLLKDSNGKFSEITEETFQGFSGDRVQTTLADTELTLHFITTKSFLGSWEILLQVLLFLMALLVLSLIFYAFPVVLVRPILKLAKHMDSIDGSSSGMLQPFEGAHSRDEVGKLIESYNRMVLRNNRLTTEVYKSIEVRQRSEYYALQSQIKPHFMLNVLQKINMLVFLGKKEEISSLLEKFGNFMRYSINWNANAMTLRDEIAHVYNYLELMGGSAHVVFTSRMEPDIDPATVLCPQFILQPVIENALKYNAEEEIQVVLQIERSGEYILVSLWNNGNPIAQAMLESLREKLSKGIYDAVTEEGGPGGTGIGLVNVNARLRYFYGEDCGLEIVNVESGGVRVTLRLRSHAAGRNEIEGSHSG